MGSREDDNICAARMDERIARQPEQVRRALDEMGGHGSSFQLKVLKRSRAYPEPGDTFRLESPLCPPLEGVVVNSHVTCGSMRDVIVVLMFAPGVSPATALSMGVPPESLMTPPQKLTDLYWRRGYFERTGSLEVDRASIGYGFYKPIAPPARRFRDEYGNVLPAEPRLLGIDGISTDIGIAIEIALESFIRGFALWPPPGWNPPPPPPPASSRGPEVLLDICHPDAVALAVAADPVCELNGYAWEAALPALLGRAGRADLLEGLSCDPEAGMFAARYRGPRAATRARELASLLNSLVASRDEVLALVRSGELDWEE